MCTCSTAKRRRKMAKIDKRYSKQTNKAQKTYRWVKVGESMKKIKV